MHWSLFIPSGSKNGSYGKVFLTDSSQENRQGQQALDRSFEGRRAHLSICLGLCRQPSALITELRKAQSLPDESRSRGGAGTRLSHPQHFIQGGCQRQAGDGCPSRPNWQWVASECLQGTAVPAVQRSGRRGVALAITEDSLRVVFGPGLHGKLALSKQRLQHNNFGLASGAGKVVFSQQRTCVVLGLLSRNVLMTVLSLACVAGSVIWVSLVDTAKACYKMVPHGDMDRTDLVTHGSTLYLCLMCTFCA